VFWFYATSEPGKALGSQVHKTKSENSALVHKRKVVEDPKTGCFGFMQPLELTHPWAPRAPKKSWKSPRITGC